jgi:uncharacterized protein YjbI with pentapeptide repeats
MLIEIKNTYTGNVLFAHEAKENSLRITLTMARKARASLRDADLCGANLYGANLRDADLCGANLRDADLCGASLRDADLCGANLYGANLCGANLRGANLYGASLYGANLRDADLYGANLRDADLCGANLYGANLRDADLCGASLYGANLRDADLRDADLCGANLYGASLYGAKNSESAIAHTRILPEGSLIGWKKCRGGVIVKLRIPEAAKRCHAFGRKCRAEYVEVLEVIGATVGISTYDTKTEYKQGVIVSCGTWGEDFTQECSGGIHFFITRIEAEQY